jgi:hypothetical protein
MVLRDPGAACRAVQERLKPTTPFNVRPDQGAGNGSGRHSRQSVGVETGQMVQPANKGAEHDAAPVSQQPWLAGEPMLCLVVACVRFDAATGRCQRDTQRCYPGATLPQSPDSRGPYLPSAPSR